MFTKEQIKTIKWSLIGDILELSKDLGLEIEDENLINSLSVEELIKRVDKLYELSYDK
jgi:hypothetical protein